MIVPRRVLTRGKLVTGVLLVVGCLGVSPSAALAAFGGSTAPGVPIDPSVAVGQTNLPANVVLTNQNSVPNTAASNTICNFGDGAPCPVGVPGIVVTPSCSVVAFPVACDPTGFDPGVFRFAATGTGDPSSACPNMIFDIVEISAASGQVRFTPRGGAHVVLPGPSVTPGAAGACTINTTVDVLKVPTKDFDPGSAGVQTVALGDHTATSTGGAPVGGQGSALPRTVRAQPTIATVATPTSNIGGTIHDQATVSGLVSPVAGAIVTFSLYGPSQGTCLGAPIFTSPIGMTLSGSTGTATSANYVPTAAGTYHWVASYSGDANNAPVTGLCNAANENSNVPPPVPPPPPPPPCTPPPGPPPPGGELCKVPPTVCTTPPGPAPPGGELCARGTAAIRGTTGCAGTAFRVVVRGRQIETVVFRLDGKVIRRLTKANRGSLYVLPVNPRALRIGVHRILATTTFKKQSGTRARVLRVTFSRCARRATSPAFTG